MCKKMQPLLPLVLAIFIITLFPSYISAQVQSKNSFKIKTDSDSARVIYSDTQYYIFSDRYNYKDRITVFNKKTFHVEKSYAPKHTNTVTQLGTYSIAADNGNYYLVNLITGKERPIPPSNRYHCFIHNNIILITDKYIMDISDPDRIIYYDYCAFDYSITYSGLAPYLFNNITSLVYVKNGQLVVLDIKTFMETTIINKIDENSFFLSSTPDCKNTFYVNEGKLMLLNENGKNIEIGEYNYTFSNPALIERNHSLSEWLGLYEIVSWNPDFSKAAIQDTSERIIVYDLVTNTFNVITKPVIDYIYSVQWSKDGKNIRLLLDYPDVLGVHYYGVYYVDNNNTCHKLNVNGSNKFTEYKDYMLFNTDIEELGHSSFFTHKLGIYNTKTDTLKLIDGVCSYRVDENGKSVYLTTYKPANADRSEIVDYTNEYLLDESKLVINKKIKATNTVKNIGQGFTILRHKDYSPTGYVITNSKPKCYVSYYPTSKVTVFASSDSKKIYFYNGKKLWSRDTKEQIIGVGYSPGWFSHYSDDNFYTYFTKSGSNYYINIAKI